MRILSAMSVKYSQPRALFSAANIIDHSIVISPVQAIEYPLRRAIKASLKRIIRLVKLMRVLRTLIKHALHNVCVCLELIEVEV